MYRQKPAIVTKLFQMGFTPEAVWWCNTLATALDETEKTGRHALNSRWLEAGRLYQGAALYELALVESSKAPVLPTEIVRLVRLLPQESDMQALTEYEMLCAELTSSHRGGGHWLAVNTKSTWGSLLRKVRERRAARFEAAELVLALRAELPKEKNPTWAGLFGHGRHRGIEVRELLSTAQLQAEGVLMEHCVGNDSFVKNCSTGHQAIFSLKEPITDTRATLQLKQDTRGWVIVQLAGPGNTVVPQIFWRVARALVDKSACIDLALDTVLRKMLNANNGAQ